MTPIRPATRLGWLCLLTAAIIGPARAERPEPADVSRWVSNDAVIFVEVTRPADLVDRLTDERIQKPLRSVPKVREVLEGPQYQQLSEVAKLVSEKLGMPWEKALRTLTGGGVVFAVEATEGHEPNTFLIATPTDTELLKKSEEVLLDLARKFAEEHGQPDLVKSREYRGVTGRQIGPKVAFGIVKGRLVIVDRGETGKMVVDRMLDGLGSAKPLAESDEWKARKASVKPEALAWGFARMDRLRKIDPKFAAKDDKRDTGQVILFGGWPEAIVKAPWIGASLTWTGEKLAAEVALPVRSGGRPEAEKGFVPPKDSGAPALVLPPGTIASLSLWRDYSTFWESRAELLSPEAVQGLAQLDGVAGQFFGGRDFGTGVLGALTSDWRLVVALQDPKTLDPMPDVKLPAFGLVIDLKPDDTDFAQRLKVAFQSFIGLVNIGAAQSKSPPLELGSETFEGITIATSKYLPAAPADKVKGGEKKEKEAVNIRHNFSPSAAQVGNHFIIGSSMGITRALVTAIKSPGKRERLSATLAVEADGSTLAQLIDLNRNRLVMQNMLEKGHDKDQAEAEIGVLSILARHLGHGRLSIKDGADATTLNVDFTLGK